MPVKGAQLVVVSIPEFAIPKLPKDLFAEADENVVIVDTGNYYRTCATGVSRRSTPGVIEARRQTWTTYCPGRVMSYNALTRCSSSR